MKRIFDSALLKLTLIYTCILVFVSVIFSISFYQVSVRELDANYIAQSQILQRRPIFDNVTERNQFVEEQLEELGQSKRRVYNRLILGNFIVLLGSTLLSYFLAKKSLEPIEEAHEAQARFTADASHELRTPLTAMQTEIEVALRDQKLTKQEAKELLSSNLDELKKLAGLSDALLTLARQADGATADKDTHKLKELLADAAKRLNGKIKAKNITVSIKCDPKQTVYADPDMLTEAIVILLDNAVKYSPGNSNVSILVSRRNRQTRIAIKDEGQGIKASELLHIFERFYRADSSRSAEGYGLGLSLARQIAELHDGTLDVSSTPGRGSTFTLKLP